MMNFSIGADELRKALAEIEAAEKNGFMHCQAVLKFKAMGHANAWIELAYSDLWERAAPNNGMLDWGRGQGVTVRNKFVNGKLVPLKGNAGNSGEARVSGGNPSRGSNGD